LLDFKKQPLEAQLAALLDGETTPEQKLELESRLATDENARKIYDKLRHGVDFGRRKLDDMLKEPVPLALVRSIKSTQPPKTPIAQRNARPQLKLAPNGRQALAAFLEQEFTEWVESSYLLKTAFREVAVIGGLVERQHPGRKKTGRQVSFSTDLIYDVLRRYEPQHLLLRAAWDDARRRMTELGRLVRLVDRASATMLHVEVDRITPMAVPLMVIVGREALPPGAEADEALLTQAEALAEEAMHLG